MTPASTRLAEAIAATVGALQPGTQADELVAGIDTAVAGAVHGYATHPHWPSRLTSHGIPIELTLALHSDRPAAFRYLIDAADHRHRLPANWTRYLALVSSISGVPAAGVSALLSAALEGSPSTVRSPVYCGLGHERLGERRASTYVFTGGIDRETFEQRFAAELGAIDESLRSIGGERGPYHGMGFDFDAHGGIARTKFYGWLPLDERRPRPTAVLGALPCARLADAVFERLGRSREPRPLERSVILQSAAARDPAACRHKLELSCLRLGIDSARALRELLAWLGARLGLDVSPLGVVQQAFTTRGVPLVPSWIALGVEPGRTALSCYFMPMLDPAVAPGARAPAADAMAARGVRYLLAQREANGGWSDGGARADAWVTARVLASIARCDEHARELARRARAAPTADDETRAFSALACARLGIGGRGPAGAPAQPPERLALAVLASSSPRPQKAGALLATLAATERWIGGWRGAGEELVVNAWIVEALTRLARDERPGVSQAAIGLLSRAHFCFTEYPVPAEPTRIAPWLKGWLLTGNDVAAPAVTRALACLRDTQQRDGSWLASPVTSAAGDVTYFDRRRLLTTAAVVEALRLVTTLAGTAARSSRPPGPSRGARRS